MPNKIQASRIDALTYDRLREAILDGTYPPGTPLVEARLAEEYGISKTPVREALIRLQRDGLVQMESYRGARVTQLTAEDARAICDTRVALESHIASALARTRPADVIDALRGSVESCQRSYDAGRRQQAASRLAEFTERMLEGYGNPRMLNMLTDLYSLLALIGSASLHEPDRIERSLAEHRAILEAIAAGDCEGAAARTATHIRSVEEDCVRHLSSNGVAQAAQG
jgi:DNA-binding GntR family transcriptional regulator